MSQTKYIDHLGKITNLVSLGDSVAFVTEHQERRPTAVVVLDLEKTTTDQVALDCYGTALLVAADKLWVAGSDSQLYVVPMNDQGKPDSSAKPKSVCELAKPQPKTTKHPKNLPRQSPTSINIRPLANSIRTPLTRCCLNPKSYGFSRLRPTGRCC